MNLIQVKAQLLKEFHLSPLELDKMQYWEYELFIKELSDLVKEQNDEQQAEMDKYHINDTMKMARNPEKMMQTPKMPSMPSISMPKI